ncbi:MAG TPA: PfkB family carbohydrate kinase, partial [Burkholderiaceae bacterium]
CCWIEGAVPVRIEDAPREMGERVEVMNVLGAGDAFAAGLLTGLLGGKDFAGAARIANACGAVVVSRHGCAPAMPTPAELAHWFGGPRSARVDADAQLAHLHRTTAPRQQWPQVSVLAFDHRAQMFELARAAGAPESRLPALKRLLLAAVEEVERRGAARGIGVLIDGTYGADALAAACGRGWWVGRPVERPGSRPLRFDGTLSLGSTLRAWPREQVVKCLVYYHPDDPAELRVEQESRLAELWEATRESGHELLLEVIAPPAATLPGTADAVVLRAVKRFYNLGLKPEWWKLAPMAAESWRHLAGLVAERDPQCRGAAILGLNQPIAALAEGFAQATDPIVKGFIVGRTLWAEPSLAWLKGTIDDATLVERVARDFTTLCKAWEESR